MCNTTGCAAVIFAIFLLNGVEMSSVIFGVFSCCMIIKVIKKPFASALNVSLFTCRILLF